MLADVLRSTAAGAVFGAALTASRVYLPTVIIDQMRLEDFHMLEVFLTASASSALVMFAFEKAGIAQRSVRPNSSLHWFSAHDGNIIGGTLLGTGMGLTGACPGTVLPQLAQGVPSATATLLGGLLGGFAHARMGKALVVKRTSVDSGSKPGSGGAAETIGSKLQVSPEGTLAAFVTITLSAVALSTTLVNSQGRSSSLMPTAAGGLLIGFAQAVSILLTSSTLGVSTAYEQVGSYLWRVLGYKDIPAPPSPPKAIFFALGILGGSIALANVVLPTISSSAGLLTKTTTTTTITTVSNLQALIGGFLLTFGARMAGGCTSGHGLSGLSSLSFSSLITTAAMFAAGVAVQSRRI